MTSYDIRHDPAASRFETTVNGHLCVCDYHRGGNAVHFTHTEVHPSLRGRGIAAALVAAALAWARQAGLQVVPHCSYVRAYLQRHPEAGAAAMP